MPGIFGPQTSPGLEADSFTPAPQTSPGLVGIGKIGAIADAYSAGPVAPSSTPVATAPLPPAGYLGGKSPYRIQTKWLTFWPATVTEVGTTTARVTLAGDEGDHWVPLEIAPPTVGRTVRVAFGDGGRCAVVGTVGGS